jgi:hypothetical protein
MSLHSFLVDLFESGRVRLTAEALLPEQESDEVERTLADFELRYRNVLPGTPPSIDLPAARYGATMLYQACRFLAHPNLGIGDLECAFGVVPPESMGPSVHYSVDLSLRFLPDVCRMTREKGAEDPLCTELSKLANQWPLSSVGIPGVTNVVVDAFVSDRCMRRLYVDRVIRCSDLFRLQDRRVQEEVVEALGAFPELAPPIVQALKELGISVPDWGEPT